MTSIARWTAGTSPLFATAAASMATASVGAAAAGFACIIFVSTSASMPFKLLTSRRR